MESSVGSPDTWHGVCLARPGMVYSDEIPITRYDFCTGGNSLTVYYLDGVWNGVEILKSATFPCPNSYACSWLGSGNDYCRYDCTADSHCASGYYCTVGHCCPQNFRWNAAAGYCEAAPNCLDCSYNVYYGSAFNPWSIEPLYRAIGACYKSSKTQACCIAEKYGSANFKDWYTISIY